MGGLSRYTSGNSNEKPGLTYNVCYQHMENSGGPMTIERIRAQIISNIWQAVAQSGVDLSSIPQEGQEKLVGSIADKVMVTMDSILDEVTQPEVVEQSTGQLPAQQTTEVEEKILWQGRPFLSISESYVITSERLKIIRGMLSRRVENYELIRVQDIDFKQGVGERIFGKGDLFIRGQDLSNPEIVLHNISSPEEVYEILRRAWLDARKRYGLQFREQM
jgi:hypothetical protein